MPGAPLVLQDVGLGDGSFAVCSAALGRASGFGVLWLSRVQQKRPHHGGFFAGWSVLRG